MPITFKHSRNYYMDDATANNVFSYFKKVLPFH